MTACQEDKEVCIVSLILLMSDIRRTIRNNAELRCVGAEQRWGQWPHLGEEKHKTDTCCDVLVCRKRASFGAVSLLWRLRKRHTLL